MFDSFFQKDSSVYRLSLCVGVGLGTLFALSPYSFLSAGIFSGSSCLLLFLSLNRTSPFKAALWLLVLSQILNYTTFWWIPGAVSRIAGVGPSASVSIFIIYGIVSHLKFVPFYFLFRTAKISSASDPKLLLLFPAAGTLADLVAYQIFPLYWGNLLSGSIVLEQSASLIGVYGLSFLCLFLTSATATFLLNFKKRGSREFKISVFAWILVVFVYGFGLYRIGYGFGPTNMENTKNISVVVIQPDTSPGTKELQADETFLSNTMSKVLSLSLRGALSSEQPPTLVVLPESSIPFHGTLDSEENRGEGIYSSTMEALVLYLSEKTGADVLFNELNMDEGKLRNQITLFRHAYGTFERYDKRRLLAFGEYLPFESAIPFLRSVFRETSRYVPGENAKLLLGSKLIGDNRKRKVPNEAVEGFPEPSRLRPVFSSPKSVADKIRKLEYSYSILPLLCYEAMFPELVLDYFPKDPKPEIMINLTNDSWFDSELEAHQHSGTVRIRAIETGLPLIRSTVSGITEVWDQRGIAIVSPIGFHETGIRTFTIDLNVPHNTVYTEMGNLPVWIFCVFVLSISFWTGFGNGKEF
ncbi:apolipoprotein N-acyltransferase [Leptospira gomenensis]|uniref:Apolipoprotein N-acyltransferase n=1 Tax=Leptospira gomenensis TaxID=2484974 RepID=A0A5F1YFT2_9LEPT|nr:nitrilase-related carbon-nitrogen hydrolase [Leptospira gomenensis]TGK39254.1 apolipoprotein N-acyltransferase [Leptospira gomenensis]TGK44000.1 apolipoprotein N-acyltransferase [Leptospira gomenensis]TGK48924.1 apolipoprotein N-acyltransferase [Leptospira gomenensis]TGK54634.1 apolipoprotein N-acyltransferase [Leptospira gomenensis]